MPQTNVTATLRAQDLEAIDNVVYEAPQEELVGRTLFNMKTDIHPGAETYGYYVMTRSGAAKVIANGADDLPLVDSDMERFHQPIYTIAAGIRFSLQELRQANLTGGTVDATKAEIARRAVSEKENRMIFTGDEKIGIKGVANADGIQVMASDKTFSAMTSDEIVESLRKARAKITIIPGYTNANLALTLPPLQYEELNRRYSDYDSRSILKVIEDNHWFSSIKPVSDLAGVGEEKTDSLVIMDTNPSTCEILLPMDITRQEQEWKYPNWTVPFEERFGGALLRAPYAVVRVDGI